MRMIDLIEKKKKHEELSNEEITFIINGYVSGDIPDYQMSAFLMSVYFNGMTKEETLNLTLAMRDSGDCLDLSAIEGIKVDKHSTGGVGDKTSLVVGPILAALGVKVAKMSGRGLGNTGGTIDKLEAFDGFSTSLTEEKFIKQVNDIGIAITGQTGNLTPADKKIYALRDVTATVDSIPLIASSIMSKKLASGADAIVLDVKCGSGAFMKNFEDAKSLAREMVDIGKGAGRKMKALITEMGEPLGYAVGNSIEVMEAIDTLNGNGPADFTELCLNIAAYMLICALPDLTIDEAKLKVKEVIDNGLALKRFSMMVKSQGGDESFVYDKSKFVLAHRIVPIILDLNADDKTLYYVKAIKCDLIGRAAMILGGGREKKGDAIDMSVGLSIYKKIGDTVSAGEIIGYLYGNDDIKIKEAMGLVKSSFDLSDEYIDHPDIIKAVIE